MEFRIRAEVISVGKSMEIDWKMLQGNHQISVDGKALSSGSYFVRLTTDENKELKKLVITK